MKTQVQLSVAMNNEPGELGRLCRALAQAQVNIEGICVVDSIDVSIVRLLVADAASAKRVLHETGFHVAEHEVLVLDLENGPGVLARVAERLGQSSININYLYGTSHTGTRRGKIVVHVSDTASAGQALD
ncbi:MAG: hypothetical protein QGD94_00425 [Planctomycetia bacterium]|nr:hypothetical protein [Planctomycetia bacterium]